MSDSQYILDHYDLLTEEEKRELDILLLPSLDELESDWRIWLRTLFPQFMRGELAPYHIEFLDWLWATLWAKRREQPLPDGNAFMSIWGRGCMKCVSWDTEVLLADSRTVLVKDLHADCLVLSVNEKTGKATRDRVKTVIASGQRSCVRLTTRSGKIITLTPEHRLWAFDGWRRVEDITVGMRIAVPRRISPHRNLGRSNEEARLLAYMLAEGATGSNYRPSGERSISCSSRFTNTDVVIVEDFTACAEVMGFSVHKVGKTKCSYDLRGAQGWLRSEGLNGKRSWEKSLPSWILNAPEEQQWNFLAAFIDTDGFVTKHGHLAITLSSERMVREIGRVFLAVGVMSWVRHRSTRKHGAWQLTVDQESLSRCLNSMPLRLKGERLRQVISVFRYSLMDTYPASVMQGLWYGLNRHIRRLGMKVGRTRYDVTRDKMRRAIALASVSQWVWLEQADVFWDKVVSIEDAGCVETYDVETEWHHNFLANGIVSHNSTLARLVPVAEAALLGKGYSLYCSGSQPQSHKHLSSIETLLTSDKVRYYYPQISKPQVRNTERGRETSRAWNQKMLQTASGFIVQAIGLDVGIRGANIDDTRVTSLIVDDIDERDDSALQSEQKMDKFLHSVLPTKKPGTIFICAQNLVLESGVINRIFTGDVPALASARRSGPHPRIEGLKTEKVERNGRQLDIIVGGRCTWPADTVENCQEDIFTYTLPVFKRECQNELTVDRTGLVLSPWDDEIHVITESQFAAVFQTRKPPPYWAKEILHDWAQSKTAYHANVVMKLAVSSQNSPLPGCLFIYDPMSFVENTQADDVAIRILESVTDRVEVHGHMRTWKEILDAEFSRLRLENFISSTTTLLSARREILAHVIPPLVGPLLQKFNYKRLRMSHEAADERKLYRRVYGLSFSGVNPKKEGGIEFANHYLRVDRSRPHPFKRGVTGWSQMYVIVPDDKEKYPTALRPDTLHDHDLIRYQFSHWRHTVPHLTETGLTERGPEKMNDDFGNALQMGMLNGGLAAEPLTHAEKIEELIPPENRLENLLQPSPTSLTGRKTMTAAQQLSYDLARHMAQSQLQRRRGRVDEFGDAY